MIFCLVTIPLAAVFGTSLPDIIKALGWGRSPGTVREQAGEAPLFVSNVPDAAARPDYPAMGLDPSEARLRNNTPQSPPQISFPDDMRAVQASFSEPASTPGSTAGISINSSAPYRPNERPVVPVSAEKSSKRFEQIQSRLQTMDYTYFRLESFGSATQVYRFQCAMPLGDNGSVRHFEATSTNSLDAMERVLADIDNWIKRR